MNQSCASDPISRVATPCMPCSDIGGDLVSDIGGDLVSSWELPLPNSYLDDDTPGDEAFQALLASRVGTKSPASGLMRGSFSLNDLTLLQQQPAHQPAWNHKLVSMKPKLEPVPEGGPSLMGGPLNLMPLGCSQPNSQTTTAPGVSSRTAGQHASGSAPGMIMPINISQKQLQKRKAAACAALNSQGGGESSDCVDNESTSSDSMPRSYPSCNTLSMQLQMTRVRSETQLSGLADQKQQQQQQQNHSGMVPVPGVMGSAVQGSTAAAVEAFRQSCAFPAYNMLQGGQQGEGEGMSAEYPNHHLHQGAAVRRAPSGLPLRKSQSAVELGSWRSFSSPEEYWDMGIVGEDGQAITMGHANHMGGPDERLTKIQRFRERHVMRGQARMPSYQPTRLKGSTGEGRQQHALGVRQEGVAGVRRMTRNSCGNGSWGGAESGVVDNCAAGVLCSGASCAGGPDQQQSLCTQPLYAQAYNIPSGLGGAGSMQLQQQQHLFGSPQLSHMHQRLRSDKRSHSFQGLSPASFVPPPPAPSNLKFSMVGSGSSVPGQIQGVQGGFHMPPTGDAPGMCSPAGAQPATSLLPSLLANPPRMLAPCLPPSHPLAGPGPCSGSIFMAGNLSQQISPAAGSLHVPAPLCLSGTPMQASPANLPSSGQTIFSGGSARLASRQQQQQQQQQPLPQQPTQACSAGHASPMEESFPCPPSLMLPSGRGAGAASAAASSSAQPMVLGEGSGG